MALLTDDLPPEVEAAGARAGARASQPDGLPELSELGWCHFTRLSQWNFSIASNLLRRLVHDEVQPIVNEWAASPRRPPDDPLWPDVLVRGALALMFELEQMLAEISGMEAVTLTPAAGARRASSSALRWCARTTSTTATRARPF